MHLLLNRIGGYLFDMLPGVAAAGVLFGLLSRRRAARLAERRLTSSRGRECVLLLFWLVCGGLAMLTLTPPDFHWLEVLRNGYFFSWRALLHLSAWNLIPFRTLGQSRMIFVGNLVMFVPFGLAEAALWRGGSWKRAVGLGLAVSGGIECFQLLVGRNFDIDDLLLNTLGVLCGHGLWRAAESLLPPLRGALYCRKK